MLLLPTSSPPCTSIKSDIFRISCIRINKTNDIFFSFGKRGKELTTQEPPVQCLVFPRMKGDLTVFMNTHHQLIKKINFHELYTFRLKLIGVALNATKALKQLHNCGFLHFDIKPNNFMFYGGDDGEEYNVYLGDLDSVFRIDEQNTSRTIQYIKTPSFCAPEVIQKDKDILDKTKNKPLISRFGTESDVFSLGMTIHLLFTLKKLIHVDVNSIEEYSNFSKIDEIYNTYTKALIKFRSAPIIELTPNKSINESFTDLLKQMLSFGGARRPKLDEVVQVLEDIQRRFTHVVKHLKFVKKSN
eukprot:GHVR01136957.1.p1 GENE.GHVR01136957.1~~GHVR01136957.1.p1  ORF type:complete len:301 (+),score=37.15 GHVR01136957.1:302-1204(+)